MKTKTVKILGIIAVLLLSGLLFVGEEAPQKEPEKELPLPAEVNLDIPFIIQAPFNDWSYPFNHTCEEAAVLMVNYYLEGQTSVDQAQIKQELLDIVEYQTKNYGFHEDTSAAQTAKLISDYYGYAAEVKYGISSEDIKKELARGNPVIVPAAGRLLNNQYFKPPGPLYHMLVIKGYNADGFITNDGGTRMGADLIYSYQVIENAIHDLEGDLLSIDSGRPAMIAVKKF